MHFQEGIHMYVYIYIYVCVCVFICMYTSRVQYVNTIGCWSGRSSICQGNMGRQEISRTTRFWKGIGYCLDWVSSGCGQDWWIDQSTRQQKRNDYQQHIYMMNTRVNKYIYIYIFIHVYICIYVFNVYTYSDAWSNMCICIYWYMFVSTHKVKYT